MDNPWWFNESSGGFTHDNDYPNSFYDPYTSNTQYEYICCNHCGDNHYSEQCPYFSTRNYMEAQPNVYNENFSLHENQNHSLYWDSNSFSSQTYYPQTSLTPYIDESIPIPEKKPSIEDKLQLILENVTEMRDWTKTKFHEHASSIENLTMHVSEIASTLESLQQNENFHENSSEQVNMESEEVWPTFCNTSEVDLVLKTNVEEENTNGSDMISIFEPQTSLSELEIIDEFLSTIYDVDSPSTAVTLTDEGHFDFVSVLTDEDQIDFVGCSRFLEVSSFVVVNKFVFPSFNLFSTCTSKLLMIDEVQVPHEHPYIFKPHCTKRNEDVVIMIFDTYD